MRLARIPELLSSFPDRKAWVENGQQKNGEDC